jgi:hypothetical protein
MLLTERMNWNAIMALTLLLVMHSMYTSSCLMDMYVTGPKL